MNSMSMHWTPAVVDMLMNTATPTDRADEPPKSIGGKSGSGSSRFSRAAISGYPADGFRPRSIVMSAFDRIFSPIAGICLAAWLIAVVPVSFNYAKLFGSFSIDAPRNTAITLVTMTGFAIFWCLMAVLVKLLVSDWLTARKQSGLTITFDRIFPLVVGLCSVGWLIAVLPLLPSYVKALGFFSLADPEKLAITIAAFIAFTIFWGLVAVMAKLLLSDWREERRQPRQSGG